MKCLKFLILIALFSANSNTVLAEKKIIKIGTGNVLEGYYSVGLKLCNYLTASNKDVGCDVIPTEGSVHNLDLLKQGRIDFALIQSDVGVEAFEGSGYYAGKEPMKNLLQVITLHDEIFTVVVKDEDKIKVFGDIEGKKISNGPPGSGSTITYNSLRKFYDFASEPVDIELNEEEYAARFCRGDIDAIIMMTGHPNALISYVAHNCEIDFVSIEKGKISKLLKSNSAFHRATMHKGFYPGITEDQETVAAPAILVTNDKIDKHILKNFMQYFHKNLSNFKQSNPVLYNLNDSNFTNNFVLPSYKILTGGK